MAANNRFFIIRPDGTTSTVTNEQLNTMRLGGFIGRDDKIIPVPGFVDPPRSAQPSQDLLANKLAAGPKIEEVEDDKDTAPIIHAVLGNSDSKNFGSIDDLEIDHAFTSASSQSLYHLQADQSEIELQLSGKDLLESKELLDRRTLYNIRFLDGRVIGPFDTFNIWERISQGMLSGTEQFSLAGSEEFKSISSHVEFRAAFKIFKESLSPKKDLDTINAGSIAVTLLKLSHQLVTGWLLIKNDSNIKLLSLAVGRPSNIRSNQNFHTQVTEELNDLFSWEKGVAWFESDALAAADNRIIPQDIFSLCRQMTDTKNGFALSRIIKILGDQKQTLQLNPRTQWKVVDEQLSELEKKTASLANQGHTMHAAVHALLASGASEEEALHALFILHISNCVCFIEEKVTEEINKLTSKLFSQQYLDLLNMDSGSSEATVQKELGSLKNRLSATTKLLSAQDPLKEKMRARFGHIERILSNRTERYVLLKSRELSQDLEKNPELAFQHKKEFLEKIVTEAIANKKYLEILPEAELYYELCPESDLAFSNILMARFFATTNPADQKPTLELLKKALRNSAKSPSILFAAASIYTEAHSFSKARKAIRSLHKIAPFDERLDNLRHDLKTALSAPYNDSISMRAPWVNVVFSTLITLVMTGLLWLLAVDMELGKTETLSQKTGNFVWIRVAVLLAFACIGFAVMHRSGIFVFFRRLSYQTSWLWIAISLIVGIFFSFFFETNNMSQLPLSVFSVFSLFIAVIFDRLYFSGFLGQDLFVSLKSPAVSVLLLTILYSLYYVSYYEFIVSSPEQILPSFFIISLGLSLPLALIQLLSKSVFAPFLLQITFIVSEFLISRKQ
jgi:hypothetical protein